MRGLHRGGVQRGPQLIPVQGGDAEAESMNLILSSIARGKEGHHGGEEGLGLSLEGWRDRGENVLDKRVGGSQGGCRPRAWPA